MSQKLVPVPMTKAQLADHLRLMAALVEASDSYEGSIQYEMPGPGMDEGEYEALPNDTYAMVQASYRIGNSEGQGGIRLIGRWTEEWDELVGEVKE